MVRMLQLAHATEIKWLVPIGSDSWRKLEARASALRPPDFAYLLDFTGPTSNHTPI